MALARLAFCFETNQVLVNRDGSGPAVPQDLDPVPHTVVQRPIRRLQLDGAGAQIQVEEQEPFEKLQAKEVTLEHFNLKTDDAKLCWRTI